MDRDDRQDDVDAINHEEVYNPSEPAHAASEVAETNLENSAETDNQPSSSIPTDTKEPAEEPVAAMDMEPATAADSEGSASLSNFGQVTTKSKKRLFVMAGISVLLCIFVGVMTFWLLSMNKEKTEETNDDISSSVVEQTRLGIALTIADGVVEYSSDGENWQALTTDTKLQENDQVRTASGSRAVLTLDDGSAIRLDTDTTISLKSLIADDIVIEQIAGTVYSRIVSSERKYTVAIDRMTYQALGTAFITTDTDEISGVQVYQSSVKTNSFGGTVTEGKQFYTKSSDAELLGRTTDIDIDRVVENKFIEWNLSQDESSNRFKEKLGVLLKVKERLEEIRKKREAEEQARLEAERILKEKSEAERKEEENDNNGKVTRGTMTLESESDDTLTWNYTGRAVHGYKLVYSKKHNQPVFGVDDAIYYSDMSMASGSLPEKADGRYYVRVCAYTAGTEDEQCVDYSNLVVVYL